MKKLKESKGFTILEMILLLCILTLLVSMAVLTFQNVRERHLAEELEENLGRFRQAIQEYYRDHGHFPCTEADFNRSADEELLKRQLMWYTNKSGEPSQIRTHDFRFGPYLHKFPVETFTGSTQVMIDTSSVIGLAELKKKIAESKDSQGGWYYQARNGFVVARLNRSLAKGAYAYF